MEHIPYGYRIENGKAAVDLTIMASLAQQESQSLSQNVKLGLQFSAISVGKCRSTTAVSSATPRTRTAGL